MPQSQSRDPMFDRLQARPRAPMTSTSLEQYLSSTEEPNHHRGIFVLIGILLVLVLFFGWYLLRQPQAPAATTQVPGLIERIFGSSNAPVVPSTANDPDQDGLEAKQEKELGTDTAKSDTDADGLTDREEAEVYKTNPLSEDTDKDSVSDGDEIGRRSDPLDPNPNAVWPPRPQIGANR